MELEMVAIRDRKANAFNRPIAVNALGQAIRSFQDEINRNDGKNDLYNHSEDFDLYHLGKWDDETGIFKSFDQPKQIAIGEELKYRG